MNYENQKVRDFLYFIMHNKKLTKEQIVIRNRLIVRDYSSLKGIKEDIEEGINLGNLDSKIISGKSNDVQHSKKVRYVPPKHLHDFLYRFNQDDILKYTCHEIDTQETIELICDYCHTKKYSLKKHSKLISQKFDMLLKEFQKNGIFLDKKFIGLLSGYIKGSAEWSQMGIKTNWCCDELLKWGDEHPGMIPSPGKNIASKQESNGFKLNTSFSSSINGRRIMYLKDLVIFVKSLFHIRRDNSLKSILAYQNKQMMSDGLKINFSPNFRDNIELLTDVDKLVQAYNKIISICKDSSKSVEMVDIELSFYEENQDVVLAIHDKNSVYGKSLKNATERIGEQQKNLIKNQINGLCDLFIEADFDGGEYARIALWNCNSKPLGEVPNIDVVKLGKVTGVKYILKFNAK